MSKVIIIGGGASGIICAIEASKNNDVILIEKNNKLAKKLLLTGNGKCNFTNLNISKENISRYYNTNYFDNSFLTFDNKKLIEYFKNIGLESRIFIRDDIRYVYPITNKSKDLYFCLYNKIIETNVNIVYNEEVVDIVINDKYKIITNKNEYIADKVVIATGGKSYEQTGSNGGIFEILKKLNYNIVKPLPALCGLESNDRLFDIVNNNRLFLKVDLFIDEQYICSEYGEVQFNKYGISGIPIMNISSKVSRAIYNNSKVYLQMDFLYELFKINNIKKEDALSYLNKRINQLKYLKIKEFFTGLFDYNLSNYIYKLMNIDNERNVNSLTEIEKNDLLNLLMHFKIDIVNTRDFNEAQITSGGVNINQIDKSTFESKINKNMYFIGEVIDVDGICGGFNLQFAFSSGYIVGNII